MIDAIYIKKQGEFGVGGGLAGIVAIQVRYFL